MRYLLRNLWFALCCLTLSFQSYSQATLTGAEYFWNTDPGVGAAIALTSQDGNFNEAVETAFANGPTLPGTAGLQSFNVRFRDFAGNWGPVYTRTIVTQPTPRNIKITAGEFFWDNDPGEGNATVLLAFDGAYDEALETVFKSLLSLPNTGGLHVFHVRLKDENGEWGPVYKRVIALQDTPRNIKITAAEYFWGTSDPGLGSGTALLAFDGAYDEALETVVQNALGLPSNAGLNLFNIRIKDENGTWGPTYKRVIALQDNPRNIKITAAEYFWGTSDPGPGAGTALLAFDGAYDEALETVFQNAAPLPGLNGIQLFNVRVKDENGQWGPLYKRTIALQDTPRNITITAAEYFWGTSDPGLGSGTTLLAFDGAFNEALETVVQAAMPIPALQGLQLFSIRVKDENGTWGPTYKRTISIQDALRNIKITAGEYFWGTTDPGAGAGTPMLCFDGAFNEALETAFTSGISSPGVGLNLFNIRLRDENNEWGPVYKRTIYIETPGNSLPIQITSSNGSSTLCQGASTQLTASGATTYTWSPAIGLSATTGASVTANPTSTTTYTVTGTDLLGNTGTANFTVTVVNSSVTPSVSVTASQTTICAATTQVVYTATATNGGTNPSYQWFKNGVSTGTNSSTFTLTSPASNDAVFCVLTSNASCASPTTATSNTITLSFSTTTVAPGISIAASQNTICAATTQVVYTATTTNGGTNPSYQWFKNGVAVGTSSSTYTLSSPASGDAVSCVLISNASCASPTTATSNTITLSFSATTIAPSISISASQTTICGSTTQVVYTAAATNGGTNPSFQWYKNGIATGANSATYVLSSPVSDDEVNCVLTSNASCLGTTNTTSNTLTLSFSASTVIPSVTISSSPGASCLATAVTFTATPTNGGANPQYVWRKNGNLVGNNSNSYSDPSIASSDVISVDLQSNASCVSGGASASNSVSIGNVLTWTGAVDDDWHKPCNWNFNQVPQCCNSVIIPATSRNPIITGIAAANDLTIHTSNGAIVTVANGANLQVQDCPLTSATNACPALAVLTTTAASSITQTTAVSGGTITYQGSSAITARGVCWGTSPNPTLANSFTTNGSGSGTFTSNLTGLTGGTTYYIRAYATNASGTSYGNQMSFVAVNPQPAYPTNSVFCASGPTLVVDVTNPTTGKTWMDRNLGASQVATSSTDAAAYGDLYQWGRGNDGHQCRNSATTTVLSSTDQPGHADFILTFNDPWDWRNPQNGNLWQGVDGVNNPCPYGYRIPTFTELNAERLSWNFENISGAFVSILKFTLATARLHSNGNLYESSLNGSYWSNTMSNADACYLLIEIASSYISINRRGSGLSIRCIKN